MNEQQIDLAFNLPEVQKNGKAVEEVLQSILKMMKEVNDYKVNYFGAGGSQGGGGSKPPKVKEDFDAIKKSQEELNRLVQRQSVLELDQAKLIAQLKVQINSKNAALKDEAKIQLGQISAYKQLTREAKLLDEAYRDLAAAKGLDNAETIKAQKLAVTARQKVSLIGQGIGDFSKNVGNYKSGYDGLAASLQGLAREVPSVQSINQLFLAWSNQLPQFFDEITKASEGIKQFKDNLKLANEAQIESQAIQKAAQESLVAQTESIIESIGASQEQAAAITEQIAAHRAEIETTGVATAETVGDYVEVYSDGTNFYAYGIGAAAGAITFTAV